MLRSRRDGRGRHNGSEADAGRERAGGSSASSGVFDRACKAIEIEDIDARLRELEAAAEQHTSGDLNGGACNDGSIGRDLNRLPRPDPVLGEMA